MAPDREAARLIYLNRLLSGCLFGGQLVWSVAVLPTYPALTDEEYLKVHTILTWYGDALMPMLGLSTTMSGYLRYRKTGRATALIGTGALVGASIAAARNLNINVHMRELRSEGTPIVDATRDELLRDRRRWAIQHLIRTTGGLVALLTALLDTGPTLKFGRPARGAKVGWLDAFAAFVLLRSGTEVGKHLAMILGRGKEAGMGKALGIRR